jgi:hypothetical protein
MNSIDPWRVILTDPSGEVIVPAPFYGHPLYWDIPSWIHYGDGNGNGNSNGGSQRLLFDGAFIGADVPSLPQRTGLTAEVAPVVAPATGGISVRKELDDKQVLHVEICVDGKRYQTSMDLAPAIALVMQKLARWHEDQHAQKAALPGAPIVIGCVDSAVGEAVNAIVGELIGCHCGTICGSFLGDIAGVVKGAAHGIASAAGKLSGGVASTLKKLKGPIGAAAATAAASAAMAIPGVGPFVAPIAGKLANDLVQSAAGDPHAQQQVAQAQQQAKTDPTIALALETATKAAANAAVAHHVQDTAKQAVQGSPLAQQLIARVVAEAQQGDPAAKAVIDLISNALRPATVSGWYDVVGQWHDIVGAVQPGATEPAGDALGRFRRHAIGAAHQVNARVVGYVVMTANVLAPGVPAHPDVRTYGFASVNEAASWYRDWLSAPGAYWYVAAFDKDAPSFPDPIFESLGMEHRVEMRGTHGASVGYNGGNPLSPAGNF